MALFMYEQMGPFPRTRILCITRTRIESDLEEIPGMYIISRSRKTVMESGPGCVLCCNKTRLVSSLDLANLDYHIHIALLILINSFVLCTVHIPSKLAFSLFSSLPSIASKLSWNELSYRIL